MKYSKLNPEQKEVFEALEKAVEFHLKDALDVQKFNIINNNYLWWIEFLDYPLFNKFASKFSGEVVKDKDDKKVFSHNFYGLNICNAFYEVSKETKLSFWYDL